MKVQQDDKLNEPGNKLPEGAIGNASNPSPKEDNMEGIGENQLLNKKAETYLREAGNIEDVPDAQDQQEADKIIQQENNNPS